MVGVGGKIPIGGIGGGLVSIRLLSSLTRLGASLLRSERTAPTTCSAFLIPTLATATSLIPRKLNIKEKIPNNNFLGIKLVAVTRV